MFHQLWLDGQDTRGLAMKREVDLRNFTSVSNDWLVAIASHPAANGKQRTLWGMG